jgi:2'-5' RNA ligase
MDGSNPPITAIKPNKMKLRKILKEIQKTPYQYGCAMLYIDFDESILTSTISNVDVYDDENGHYGLETEPHVTLLYGLHTNVPDGVVSQIINQVPFGDIKLTNPSIFEGNPDYDVLKFDASGEGLERANELLKKLPHSNDYPEYHPHMTVAYLKKGKWQQYTNKFMEMHFEVSPLYVIYSKSDGSKHKFKIR